GQLEGKRREPAGHELAWLADRDPWPALAPSAASHCERRLMQTELLEGQSLPGRLSLGGRIGEVRGAQRVGLAAQPAPSAQLRRQRLQRVGCNGERLPRPFAKAGGGQLASGV